MTHPAGILKNFQEGSMKVIVAGSRDIAGYGVCAATLVTPASKPVTHHTYNNATISTTANQVIRRK